MSLSEAAVQAAIRVRAADLGIPLERNNSGACEDKNGRQIRYGLANDSAQKNKRIKSGDLVGLLPLHLRTMPGDGELGFPDTFGVFLSVECKDSEWFKFAEDPHATHRHGFNDREEAQAKWIDHVRKYGGVAFFARSVEEFEREIRKAGFNA